MVLLVLILGYIGYRFEDKRKTWYGYHTLRAEYISRLMQDKQRMKELQEQWERIVSMSESDEQHTEVWKEILDLLDNTLHGTLTQLRFEGATCTEKLQGMTKDDLWTIERLWQAHSFVTRAQAATMSSEKDEAEQSDQQDIPPVTQETVNKAVEIYKESLIWLGLLPHWA